MAGQACCHCPGLIVISRSARSFQPGGSCFIHEKLFCCSGKGKHQQKLFKNNPPVSSIFDSARLCSPNVTFSVIVAFFLTKIVTFCLPAAGHPVLLGRFREKLFFKSS
jgi:hypothetical protein